MRKCSCSPIRTIRINVTLELCMTISRDLVNHKKWSWYKIDARNGKSLLKLVRESILRPLRERFYSDFKVKEFTETYMENSCSMAIGKLCHPAPRVRSLKIFKRSNRSKITHFNASDLKFDHSGRSFLPRPFFMINKVT